MFSGSCSKTQDAQDLNFLDRERWRLGSRGDGILGIHLGTIMGVRKESFRGVKAGWPWVYRVECGVGIR